MYEGLNKILSYFILYFIKVEKLKWFKKVLSDMKIIFVIDLVNLGFFDFWGEWSMLINFN